MGARFNFLDHMNTTDRHPHQNRLHGQRGAIFAKPHPSPDLSSATPPGTAWRRIAITVSVFAFFSAFGAFAMDEAATVALALRLSHEGDARGAAIEFRRLGMAIPDAGRRSAYYWAAAYHYLEADVPSVAETMLDRAEDADLHMEDQVVVLRAEAASQRGNYAESAFFWESLVRREVDAEADTLARRRLAALHLRRNDPDTARQWLRDAPIDDPAARSAVETYARGRDKRPALGGVLGLIPGLGYAYAGEYANAFRSLLLNALFLYGMADTARNNHWGGFAVITFFELTWYSGSIYGGIDASHRYNTRRLQQALDEIESRPTVAPDWERLPRIYLRYTF